MATQWQICAAQDTAEAETWIDCGGLGMSDIVRTRQGDGRDTVTFTVIAASALTDAPLFAFHTYVRIRRVDNGTPTLWFYGRVKTPRRHGSGSDESRSYLVAGPGEQLAATTYRQDWVESAGTISNPRVVLFQAQNGTRCTSGAQILDAVAWARACGVRIAEPDAEDIITGVALPFDERVNIKCADVVADCLRWHPHAVVWWDYAEREPVFHCALRDTLTPVSVAAAAVSSDIDITAREDLQIPAVCICYEKPHVDDDREWIQTEFDVAPLVEGETPGERALRLNRPDVVWATFDLQGASASRAAQKIVTEPFPEDYLDKAWWKAREPWLQDYADADITLSSGGRAGDSDLPRILIEGGMQPWMGKSEEPERVTVLATVTKREGSQIVLVEQRPVIITVRATDATTKTYRTVQAYDSGESVPEGVAASLYAEWSGLHHEGVITIEEQECSGSVAPGRALNLTGGRAEWASMLAMVWRVTETVDAGTSVIEFGPVATLDADSLVALFRATRNRRFAFSRTFREGADETEAPGEGSAGIVTAPAYSGLATTKRMVLLDLAAAVKHLIDLDSAAFAFATGSDGNTVRTIKPREVLMPYNDAGTIRAKVVQALCSASYGSAVDLGGDGKIKANSSDTSPGYLDAKVERSIVVDATTKKARLSGDVDAPGNYYAYCTNGSGVKGWVQGLVLDL